MLPDNAADLSDIAFCPFPRLPVAIMVNYYLSLSYGSGAP
jgi:hypothetical protein